MGTTYTNVLAGGLRKEGHNIEPGKGKKPPKVKDFEKALVEGIVL